MVTLHSFAELAEALHLLPGDGTDGAGEDYDTAGEAVPQRSDLAALLATLQNASATLQAAGQRDAATRDAALAALECYETALVGQREAADAYETARRVQAEAQTLAAGAFTEDCRAAAEAVVGEAARAAVVASQMLGQRRREAEALAASLDVTRVAEARERQRRQAEERAKEMERDRERAAGIAQVRKFLSAGRLAEADAALVPLRGTVPEDGELQALGAQVRERVVRARIGAAAFALPAAFRDLRHRPEAAVRRLEGLAVDGLPDDLARRVFGAWAEGCARLCQERGVAAPLRYAPDPGRGLVLIPDGKGGHTVLSALGLGDRFPAGTAVPDRIVRLARPLRPVQRRED